MSRFHSFFSLRLLIRPLNSEAASHPFARKKAQGWGTDSQYLRAGSIELIVWLGLLLLTPTAALAAPTPTALRVAIVGLVNPHVNALLASLPQRKDVQLVGIV